MYLQQSIWFYISFRYFGGTFGLLRRFKEILKQKSSSETGTTNFRVPTGVREVNMRPFRVFRPLTIFSPFLKETFNEGSSRRCISVSRLTAVV